MRTVVFAPAALDRLTDIFAWTADRFGEGQAEAYAARLARRLEALAAGEGPQPRPCERLMQGVREASGLVFYCRGFPLPDPAGEAGNARSGRDISRADEYRSASGAPRSPVAWGPAVHLPHISGGRAGRGRPTSPALAVVAERPVAGSEDDPPAPCPGRERRRNRAGRRAGEAGPIRGAWRYWRRPESILPGDL